MAQPSWIETVTLKQARQIIHCMAHQHSVLLLSGPGVGKSDIVYQSAAEAKLPCRSLVGTQIAPEDVSGIPRIIGERSVFCPPRVLLPEKPEPFCLFLDELPACTPDIQKAFYALLLERRLGEHPLPAGTWVVAAGNRVEDRSLVRALSSALVNRVIILQVRVDVGEWLDWARGQQLRPEVITFIEQHPDMLQRPVPDKPSPFSTPRAWATLARALDLVEGAGRLTPAIRLALAVGRLTPADAETYCRWAERGRVSRAPLSELALPAEESDRLSREGVTTLDQLLSDPDPEAQPAAGARSGDRAPTGNGAPRKSSPLAPAVRACLQELGYPDSWFRIDGSRVIFQIPAAGQVTITLSQAKMLIQCLAREQSLLLQAPPGVGKTAIVAQAAAETGLPCRSLLGTQIAPEDVSGIPRIVGERSVFCPPRVLLPEKPEPFCLFLDELPACNADVQKAFYPLFLERRLGEHPLPAGNWVVAAGNRTEDRALVRDLSAALVNRLFLLQVRVDADEWFEWAAGQNLREEVVLFLRHMPEALMRPVPAEPVPFSTPRAWAMLAEALDLAERGGILTPAIRRALAFGRVSPEDAAMFCAMAEESIAKLQPAEHYVTHPEDLPRTETARLFMLNRVRRLAETGKLDRYPPAQITRFLRSLSQEHRLTLLVDMVPQWGALGADEVMLETLWEVTGVSGK
ncbi:MAG: AAA family ATPase [Gemmataceae bacterium]|nr:AAA family ATPase [Gemmataceae bacterium]